jgi:uncharacterized protein (DUF433 family)
VAWIEGTRTKVLELVIDKLAHGSSPEEMHFQYPHLSMAQIHAALTYYYDNRDALEEEIDRRYRAAEAMRVQASTSPLQQRLRALTAKQ